jgi:hypothetical protein
MLRGCFNVI